uniref:Bcl-2 Bcl-2 homology region 1-3 domain-containing protein n=1 Tax=Biomphalaria glabrata TaxID=6526 RepID=A0A182YU44_BIOGL
MSLNLTPEIVMHENHGVLLTFFDESMQRDGIEKTAEMQQLLDSEAAKSQKMRLYKEHARKLLVIADEIDSKSSVTMQDLVSKIPPDAEREILIQVAQKILSEDITWGKIAALFLFTYKVCIRVIDGFSLIKNVINIILDFMASRVVSWIIQKGGWKAIQENTIRPTIYRISIGIIFLSVGVTLLFLYRK